MRNKHIEILFSFFQQITYHIYANSGRKKVENETIVESETMGGCRSNQNDFYRINLRVPPIPPTDDMTSNICKVRYNIRVSSLNDKILKRENVSNLIKKRLTNSGIRFS